MAEEGEELTFETLLKLRDEVGLKTFKQFEAEKFYNKNDPKKRRVKESNRNSDDEAPMEISSKTPFKKNKPSQKWRVEKQHPIDPRFSDRSGRFSDERFKKDYQHAFELRETELQTLKDTQSKDEHNEAETSKRKYLIQRMENQKRESRMKSKKPQNKPVEVLQDGTKFYKKKKVQRTEDLVNKFLELKKSGQLEKHLDKRRKKLAGKERKKMNIEK
jgi:ribosomal RNA-processing protein 36